MDQPNDSTQGGTPFDPNSFGRRPFESSSNSGPQSNSSQSIPPYSGSQNGGPRPAGPYPAGPQYAGPRPWQSYSVPAKPNGCWLFIKRLFLAVAGFFFFLFIIGFMLNALLVGMGGPETKVIEKTLSGDASCPAKIAILPIEGTITEDEDGFIRHAIRTAYEDPKIAGIVLRINSPGGTIAGSDYYYHLLEGLKAEREIPIVVSMGPIAASGGYYIAMAGDEIFAERSTITGSIGVIIMLLNGAGLCEKVGIGMNNIVSGPNKGMGDFTRPLTDGERAIWQGMVDESYAQFLSVIREGRPIFAEKKADEGKDDETDGEKEASDEKTEKPKKTLEEIADGRVYSAAEAKELGLIDEIGFLDAAVSAVKKRADLDESPVQVVRYKEPEGLADILTRAEAGGASGKIGALVETLAVPQLYYLAPGALPVQ